MATIERERPRTLIHIWESPEVEVFDQMIDAARRDLWVVGYQEDYLGRNCALGMIERYGRGGGTFVNYYDRAFGDGGVADRVHDLLLAAIPPDFEINPDWEPSTRVATYNNTLTAPEAIEWFERAKLLA